jgi:ribosomal protein L28
MMNRQYQQRECLVCGRIIREGAYSGQAGNFTKHALTHERMPEYRIGSVVTYIALDGKAHRVKVTARVMRKGLPGFSGIECRIEPAGLTTELVWGWNHQIISVDGAQ